MRKLVAAINMTLDGFCDHDAVDPDEEVHYYYADLLKSADVILYGRKTYQLMQFWQSLLKEPSGQKSMDDFAVAIDQIPKVVFSHTLTDSGWDSAKLSDQPLKEKVSELKQQPGGVILAGSRSLILQLMELNLIDELHLCIHPVVAGKGLPLFENIKHTSFFNLKSTRTFKGGAVIFYYEPLTVGQ